MEVIKDKAEDKDDLDMFTKLLNSQNEDLEVELKKIAAMVRQIIATENKIEKIKQKYPEGTKI